MNAEQFAGLWAHRLAAQVKHGALQMCLDGVYRSTDNASVSIIIQREHRIIERKTKEDLKRFLYTIILEIVNECEKLQKQEYREKVIRILKKYSIRADPPSGGTQVHDSWKDAIKYYFTQGVF